jgi:hypothetical protein
MFNWFSEYRRPKYPTWDDVPDLNKVNNDMEKIGQDMNKVIQFPELKVAPPPMPEVSKETGGKTVYSLGLTDNNRVSITMGYSSVTMNSVGIQQLIDQLTLFKSQIEGNEDNE